jgi:hypothetical protein
MAQWWDNYKETELSWTDWKQESKKLRTEGLNKEEIFKKIGVPTKDGQVIKVTSDGAGGYKPRTGQRAQQASRRTTRIGTSKQEVNKSIRIEATKQWDELVGDRDTTIKIGNRNYTFDQYLNKEVRDHTKLTKQKAVEAVNLGKTLGHGTPTTDIGRYAESYTQQFAESGAGNFASQDYIPPDQLERLKRAGLATNPQEAAQLHVGTTEVGGRLPDPEIESTLKFDFSGGGARVAARRLAIAGLLSYGAFGTAASAAETAQRTQIAQQTGDPLDILQAGIAGVSTAADFAAYNPVASLPAEVVSTVADVTNVGIDAARSIDIGNELKYIGGQVRLGRLPYGLEQVASWAKSAF